MFCLTVSVSGNLRTLLTCRKKTGLFSKFIFFENIKEKAVPQTAGNEILLTIRYIEHTIQILIVRHFHSINKSVACLFHIHSIQDARLP